ncbi:MAG: HlyC/CorC family transporter [Alphaproteobacteria bacterium]|nr:HlyC/CorC family transporter [Alphaproteobacteria bacterium]
MDSYPSTERHLDVEHIKGHSKAKKFKLFSWLFKSKEPNKNEKDNDFEEKIIDLVKNHDATNKISGIEGRFLLHNMLEFGSLTASDVMIQRSDIVAVSSSINSDELMEIFLKEEHTRLPVYQDSLDNMLGFIHIKDLLPYLRGENKNKFTIDAIIRPLILAVPTMNIIDLLVKMRSARVHMAVVVDEYGGIDGILTIEDLLEQIVGSIEDEHDEGDSLEIFKINDKLYEANARVSIEKIEEELGMNIFDGEEEDCETLAGLIFLLAGEVPTKGEIVHHPLGIEFHILEADPRNVKKVRIKLPSNEEQETE